MGHTSATELAEFASALTYERIPGNVVAHTKVCLLDAVGCALHGSTLPWCRILTDHVVAEGGRPVAAVWGTAARVSPTQAALVNGTAGHSFEMDDLHHTGGLHSGAVTVSTALALAGLTGTTGKEFLTALVEIGRAHV